MAERIDLDAVDPDDLSLTLARAHRSVPVATNLTLPGLETHRAVLGGATLDAIVRGAGWEQIPPAGERGVGSDVTRRDAPRVRSFRTLPDTLRPGLRLVIVGINPSPTAADTGIAFARSGNRFWPAALEAGLVSTDRDHPAALADHCVGFTDIAHRTTAAAAELTAAELRDGLDDLDLKMAWARPALVVMMGISVWRSHRDPAAALGASGCTVGGRPVWVAPNPSGRNAHVTLEGMVEQFCQILAAVGAVE